MLDVGGRDQIHIGQLLACGVHPAERLDHAAPAVGAGAAAQPYHYSDRTGGHCGRDELPDPPAVRRHRGLRGRRSAEQRQPAGLRALDVCGARVGVVEHPVGVHLGGQRAADTQRAPLTEATREDVDESRSAIGLRGKGQFVVRPGLVPPIGDRLCGLDRGEAVAEAVGRDQHAEAVRTGHLSRLCWQA